MSVPVPTFPALSCVLREDLTGELTMNNTTYPITASTLRRLRVGVIGHAAASARTMGRPVKLTAAEPGGSFTIAVHPDGYVQPLNTDHTVDDIPPGYPRPVEHDDCRECGDVADVAQNFCVWCGAREPLAVVQPAGGGVK